MSTSEALEKVRKLLRMTEARGCTEAEARQAAMMAQRIMLAHRIDAAAIDLTAAGPAPVQPVEVWGDPLDAQKSRQTWRGRLAVAVASANGCVVYWNGSRLMLVGTADNAAAARYIYTFAAAEIDRMARRYSGNGRTWINNWRLGAADGVAASLREAREEARRESASTGTALVVIDNAFALVAREERRADAHMRASVPGMRRGHATASRYDHNARETGKRDGRTINTGGGARLGSGSRLLK